MNKLAQALSIILTIASCSIIAQYRNVRISDALNNYEPQECMIVISPDNPNHLMAVSNSNKYYYSTDGGNNWSYNIIQSPLGVIGDPVAAAGNNGKFFYFHLVSGLSKVVCHKLTNIGGSWNQVAYTGENGTKQNDKEWGVINPINNYLYVAWAQFDRHGSSNYSDSSAIILSRSTNEGTSWSQPVLISRKKGNAQGGNYSAHCPMPAVGPNNNVYVTWMGPDGLMFDKSTDGGVTWLTYDINVAKYHVDWLLFNISGIQRAPNFPAINCDLSKSIYRGNIYITWADQKNGGYNTDVWICRSTDGGTTWNTPKVVNETVNDPGSHQFKTNHIPANKPQL